MTLIDTNYEGAAVKTTSSTSFTAGAPGAGGTFTVASDAGYPVTGKFEVMLDRGLATEEKVLINSRSGTTFTVGQRGYDDTAAQAHTANSVTVELCLSATVVQMLVNHQNGAEADPHAATLLNNARHDIEARHNFGGAYGTPVTPTALTPDIAGAAGSGNNPAREDHAHNVPADVAITITGTNAEGAAATFARSNHNHAIGGTNHIPAAALVNKSVGLAQLTDGIIANGSTLLDSDEQLVYVQPTNPGAVGANRLWFNTTAAKRALLVRNAANTAWEVVQSFGPGINYTPTLYGFSIGTAPFGGFNTARYRRHGRTIIADGFCQFGTDSPALTGRMAIGLPVLAANLSAEFADEFYNHGAARATDVSANAVFGAVGVIGMSTGYTYDRLDFLATAAGSDWDADTPFPWNGANNDRFSWFCEYEAASAEDTNFV